MWEIFPDRLGKQGFKYRRGLAKHSQCWFYIMELIFWGNPVAVDIEWKKVRENCESKEQRQWAHKYSWERRWKLKKTAFVAFLPRLFFKPEVWRGGGNALKVLRGRCWLNIRRNFFMERVLKHCSRQPREVVKSTSLEVFKGCRAVVLKDMI